MAKYYNSDTLIEFVKQNTPNLNGETTIECVERAIKETPTADVEEVVRCIDCKHSVYLNYCSINKYKCKRIVTNPLFGADFYCKHGERKEDG